MGASSRRSSSSSPVTMKLRFSIDCGSNNQDIVVISELQGREFMRVWLNVVAAQEVLDLEHRLRRNVELFSQHPFQFFKHNLADY